MFNHMVMFRFKDGTTKEQIDAITAGLATLPAAIDVLVAYRYGKDAGVTDGSWDYGVTAQFAEESHYVTYSDHPAHRMVVDNQISPFVEQIARVQFRT